MALTKTIRWQDGAGGLEHLEAQITPTGVSVHSIVAPGEERFGVAYAIECDSDFHFRRASIQIVGGRKVELAFSPPAGWTLDGEPLDGVADAQEIDITATPFTNTLAIRRLGLRVGESANIVVTYVVCPTLETYPDPQRYTRLAKDVYRFEALDTGFTRDIVVDEDGFVVDYPGLFARV